LEAAIFLPAEIAKIMDKSAIVNFRRFLARHPRVKKWLVAADFSLGNSRPLGCFAFTVVPYDAWPWDLERDVVAALAKDLRTQSRSPRTPSHDCGTIAASILRLP
jgi:hypothetical protein